MSSFPTIDTSNPLIPMPITTPSSSSSSASFNTSQPLDRRKGITKLTVYVYEENGLKSPLPPLTATGSEGTGEGSPAINARNEKARRPGSKKPRWGTREFKGYYLFYLVGLPLAIWWPIRLSLSSHPNFETYERRLSPGWMFGRQVDISDPQYRSFRSNLPSLLLLSLFHLLASLLRTHLLPSLSQTTFLHVFNILLLFILHGTSAFKVLAILAGNYWVVRRMRGRRWAVAAVWVGNLGVLWLNDWGGGYRYGAIHESLGVLDQYSGVLPRWHVNFNITMLRLISYGIDAHWASISSTSSPTSSTTASSTTPVTPILNTASLTPTTNKERVAMSLPEDAYGWKELVAYACYPPLYIAGPIMTFNDFTWQMRKPIAIAPRHLLSYTLRFLTCLLTMEVILHFMYVVAIKDEGRRAWEGDSPADLSVVGFWNLIIVWLKLLIPWRFFRLWALLDGVDPPENMIRCMANNYSTMGFWRSWHRSYNLWTVRYIYIPLGGASNVIVATGLVFTFVALWHDLSFRLLAWGWLISLFILPELLAKRLFPASKFGSYEWFRHLAAAGATFNVLLMMTANLVGFVIGVDGTKFLLIQLTSSWEGLKFFGFASICIFVTVQLMFEYREEEARQGIRRKC